MLTDPAALAAWERIEDQIAVALLGTSGLHLIRGDDFGPYPVPDYDDPERDNLGHIPYTPLFYAALATVIARRIHALASPAYKVIALDCDNTLWKGVVGEDGTTGITIPPAWRALQYFMVELAGRGFLLCLCSKNAEADVLDVLDERPDMILKRRASSCLADQLAAQARKSAVPGSRPEPGTRELHFHRRQPA